MKKIFLGLVPFLFSLTIFSQTKGGEAVYTFKLNPSEKLREKSEYLAEMMEEANTYAESMELSLIFNVKQSFFSGKQDDGIINKNEKMALTWCGCSNDYYVDIDSKSIIYNSRESSMIGIKKNEYLIEKPMETDWVLSGESKEINDILCYKATQTITYNNGQKDFTKIVTAWYAPEIPYSFGPNGYGGLPGLIIELHDQRVVFGLNKIKFWNTEPEINFPIKGKKVTYKEYEDIMKKQMSEVMENMKSMESGR